MATGSEIAERVLGVVQDDSFTENTVISLINDCVKAISRKMILPALDTEGTVTTLTDAAVVPLPVNFQRNLYHAQNPAAYQSIKILNSRGAMLSEHMRLDQPGTIVRSVAAVKPFLLYAPIPTVATIITLRYQRKPTVITERTEVDLFPDGFEDVPFYYACWQLYSKIEQGIDGAKVDTNYYMALYLGMRDELELSLKEGVSLPPPPIARMERW